MGCLQLQAQTAEEFLQPKKTQEEYLLIQIGALKLQSGLVKRSAQIFEVGLGTWNTLRELEEMSHKGFFESFNQLGAFGSKSLMAIGERGWTASELHDLLLKSRRQWQSKLAKEDWSSWSRKTHDLLLKEVNHLGEQVELLNSNDGLKVSDAERAGLMEIAGNALQKEIRKYNQLQQLHFAYLKEMEIRRQWLRESLIHY